MTTKEKRLEALLERYIQRVTSPEEERELMALLADANLAGKREELIEKAYDSTSAEYSLTSSQAEAIFAQIVGNPVNKRNQGRIIQLNWKRWAAAAAIVAAVASGGYFVWNNSLSKNNAEKTAKHTQTDVLAPATNRAMITLSNGQSIYLDSVASGNLLQQNGVEIVKLADGKIAYTGTTTEVLYNTLTNPRGSKVIDMALADGSHVWLNAGSSVSFPLAFVGKERRVSITGEAYFEVAKNAASPFIVDVAGKCSVEVLGTHFNVNAYSDEASINTTLLEGSVKVTAQATSESKLISPGQQIQLYSNEQLVLNANPRIEQVMAWKNGYLNFENADLPMVMRKLARWYDVDIVYEGETPRRQFGGEIQSDLSLSQVLNILQKNNVTFKIEGRKLIVRK